MPDAFERVVRPRALSAWLPIVPRAHSEAEVANLKRHGANAVVMGKQEIAIAMLPSSTKKLAARLQQSSSDTCGVAHKIVADKRTIVVFAIQQLRKFRWMELPS